MITIQKNGAAINLNGANPGAGAEITISGVKLVHTRTGRELRFTEHVPEHTPSFARLARVEMFDDVTPTGTATVRRFFGYVAAIEPAGGEVQITCVDPIAMLQQVPARDANESPRLVFNVALQDYDFPDSVANPTRDLTTPPLVPPQSPAPFNLSEFWMWFFDTHGAKIAAECPPLAAGSLYDQNATVNGSKVKDHYVKTLAGDPLFDAGNPNALVLHEDLRFEPQRFIVQTQTLGMVFDQLRSFAPDWELHFDPETLKFRWLLRPDIGLGADNPLATMDRTLNKINDPSAGYQRPILSKEVGTTLLDRWTRVEISGPPKQTPAYAKLSLGPAPTSPNIALIKDWSAADEAGYTIMAARQNESSTASYAKWHVFRRYKIVTDAADPKAAAKKRITRVIREGIYPPGSPGIPAPGSLPAGRSIEFHTLNIFRTYRPVLAAKFIINGVAAWFHVPASFDYYNGIAIAANPLVLGDIRYGDTLYVAPTDVWLCYAWPDDPIIASYPVAAGTFEGTAKTLFNVERTHKEYEEDYWDPATATMDQPLQTPNYKRLAKAVWRTRGDVVHTGVAVAHGIDYSFEGFSAARSENYGRLNLPGLDDSGVSVVTGWETMKAPVHEVEYDYELQATTISFNSDWAEYVFGDFASLRLRALEAAIRLRPRFIHAITTGFVPGRPVKTQGLINVDIEQTDPFAPGF